MSKKRNQDDDAEDALLCSLVNAQAQLDAMTAAKNKALEALKALAYAAEGHDEHCDWVRGNEGDYCTCYRNLGEAQKLIAEMEEVK